LSKLTRSRREFRGMGVPGFYRWAVRKVPNLRLNTSNPPYEFDNLYLDFNGVVHGCLDDWSVQEHEDFLFQLIEAQLVLLISIVRPRVLLFVAIDGVAPRAKMNQQRSRRFRAARDKEDAADTLDGALNTFDRNAITPGTPFMVRLGERLRNWAKVNASRPELCGVTVVISCDREPGEGEHKIMDVIRRHPEHTHCLMSNDADLVFLGLVSSSEHVYLLRTKPNYEKRARADSEAVPDPPVGAVVDEGAENGGFAVNEATAAAEAAAAAVAGAEDYEMLSIVALRRWLAGQFPDCDERRLAHDFVAMCCLAGNDFLPHMAAVDIYGGGLDKLITAYRSLKPAEDGYLTSEDLSLVLPRWRLLLEHVAKEEAEVLLDTVGLGLGPRQAAYHGPGPPTDEWDGLSVVVAGVSIRASASDVQASMSKHDHGVRSVHRIRGQSRGHVSWLARFESPEAAVDTLVSARRIWGQRVTLTWADPEKLELEGEKLEVLEAVDWRSAMGAAIRESFEFWLGPVNLPKDAYLRRHVRSRKDRFVPIRVFTAFKRMRSWMQDCGEIAKFLRDSALIEVEGEGADAAVRGVQDNSVRDGELSDQVARQYDAVACVLAGDYVKSVTMLRQEYYVRYAGPAGADSPPAGDLAATERYRSRAFLSGIEWVLRYYVKGCSSWSWFYPAHYPPLCASLVQETFSPLERPPLHAPWPPELQLMAVLPPQSSRLLPELIQPLLQDPASVVSDFYPREFEVDLKEGDKDWQAIVLLPFVEEARIRKALADFGDAFVTSPVKAACAFRAEDSTSSVSSWDFEYGGDLPPSRACRDASGVPVQMAEAALAASERKHVESSGGKGKGKGKGKRDGKGKGRWQADRAVGSADAGAVRPGQDLPNVAAEGLADLQPARGFGEDSRDCRCAIA